MTIEHFQDLVIGSGVADKHLAWARAKQGQKTFVVERSMVGGSCPNVACLPSKNVIYSAKAVSLVHPTTGLGVVTGSVRVDMAGVAKALVGADDCIPGFTAFGAEASELMAVAQTAILGGIPYTVLRDTIWTHPTTAEGLIGLFSNPPSVPSPRHLSPKAGGEGRGEGA
jgi:pyruvate/2-oxoglutarate dehydrogenase complex dihydrolipoamide dehydrogenase (E3) component